MKRVLCFVLISAMVLLTGCSLFSNSPSTSNFTVTNVAPTITEPASTDTPIPSVTGIIGNSKAVTLFYQDKDGYVVPMTRRVVDSDGIARTAITGLIDDAINNQSIQPFGLYTILPKGTKILGLTISDFTATIDFNDKLLEYTNENDEKNIIESIVYTLTDFPTVKNVKILVNSYAKSKLKYGTDISKNLNRDNTLINANKVNLNAGKKKFDIFLSKDINNKYNYLIPMSVESATFSDSSLTKKIISELTNGYNSKSLYSALPTKTKLLSSKINSGMLTLDFNSELTNYGGSTKEDAIVNQILYSMKQVDGVDKVKFLINGKAGYLPEGTDISKAMHVPSTINDFIDK